MAFAGLLNRRVTVERVSRVETGPGIFREVPAPSSEIPVRIRPAGWRDVQRAGRTDAALTHVADAPADADVVRDDVLVDASTTPPVRYRVLAVRRDSAGHHLQIDCEAVQEGR